MSLLRMQWCNVGRAVPARKSKSNHATAAGIFYWRNHDPVFCRFFNPPTEQELEQARFTQSCARVGMILAGQLATADTVGRDHAQDEKNTPKDAKRQERDHD